MQASLSVNACVWREGDANLSLVMAMHGLCPDFRVFDFWVRVSFSKPFSTSCFQGATHFASTDAKEGQ